MVGSLLPGVVFKRDLHSKLKMESSGFAMFILKCVSDLNFQRGSFGRSVIDEIWIPTLDASSGFAIFILKNRIRLLLGEPKEEDSLSC